jgi:hypothetical protein
MNCTLKKVLLRFFKRKLSERGNKIMNSILSAGKIFVSTLLSWLLCSSLLFAKDGAATEGGGEGSWVFSYFLAGLAVVLGMLVVCRASNRRERVRPEGYTEGKVGHAKEEKK